ncbi:hypothetical protein [Endozoicomonas sp. SCSIO W0465]|nr:hypothetical protein [Endozoicomonas sp. SCSIO W0465]
MSARSPDYQLNSASNHSEQAKSYIIIRNDEVHTATVFQLSFNG